MVQNVCSKGSRDYRFAVCKHIKQVGILKHWLQTVTLALRSYPELQNVTFEISK